MRIFALILLSGCAIVPKVTLVTVGPPQPAPLLVLPEEQKSDASPIPIAPPSMFQNNNCDFYPNCEK